MVAENWGALQGNAEIAGTPMSSIDSLLAATAYTYNLTLTTVLNTEVIKPLRADAGQYFMYAYNLRHKHTYSHQVDNPDDLKSPVKPDAVRSPGYPLFLALFVDGLPTKRMIIRARQRPAAASLMCTLSLSENVNFWNPS